MLDKIEADAVALSGAITEDTSEAEDRSRADVLALLRELMERAERGEIVAVGICAVHPDNSIGTIFEAGKSWASLGWASVELTERLREHGRTTCTDCGAPR